MLETKLPVDNTVFDAIVAQLVEAGLAHRSNQPAETNAYFWETPQTTAITTEPTGTQGPTSAPGVAAVSTTTQPAVGALRIEQLGSSSWSRDGAWEEARDAIRSESSKITAGQVDSAQSSSSLCSTVGSSMPESSLVKEGVTVEPRLSVESSARLVGSSVERVVRGASHAVAPPSGSDPVQATRTNRSLQISSSRAQSTVKTSHAYSVHWRVLWSC